MRFSRVLAVAGLGIALAVPAGVAVASAATTTPTTPTTSTTAPADRDDRPWRGQGRGPGGGMRAGEDCPWRDSAEMQKWREGREERQAKMRELHGEGWTPPRDGTGPFHDSSPRAKASQES
jgi:hypothetical protein